MCKLSKESMTKKLTADILMTIAGMLFSISIIPQICKVYQKKSGNQVSGFFLGLYSTAIVLFMVGKIVIGCYIAASFDLIGLGGYATLIGLKLHYGK